MDRLAKGWRGRRGRSGMLSVGEGMPTVYKRNIGTFARTLPSLNAHEESSTRTLSSHNFATNAKNEE